MAPRDLSLEFELVETPEKAVAFGGTTEYLSETQASKDWSLSDVELKCHLLTLDNGLDNEYTQQHLLQGKAFSINLSTLISSMQVIAGAVSSDNISCSASRLQSFFVTYDGPHTADSLCYLKEANDKGYRYDARNEL